MNMANRISVQSTIEKPAGSAAVVVPDVFPSVGQTASRPDALANIHDVISGSLPSPLTDQNRRGWLRLAMPTGDYPAYVDPALSAEEQAEIYEGYRRAETGKVVFDAIEEVPRGMIRVDELVSRVRVDKGSIYFPRPEKNLSRAWPIESALAFSGRIALGEGERFVFGIHIPSGNEHGWARVMDPEDNAGEPAKLQHEPGALHTYEELLSRLR